MRPRPTCIQLIALLMVAAACGKSELAAGVSDSAFVTTMAELRQVSANRTQDSAQIAAARAAVLQRRGLTTQQLEHAAQVLADDPDRAAKVWQAIAKRADSSAVRP